MKKIGTIATAPVYVTDATIITASGRGGGIEGELADKVKRTPDGVIVIDIATAREMLRERVQAETAHAAAMARYLRARAAGKAWPTEPSPLPASRFAPIDEDPAEDLGA